VSIDVVSVDAARSRSDICSGLLAQGNNRLHTMSGNCWVSTPEQYESPTIRSERPRASALVSRPKDSSTYRTAYGRRFEHVANPRTLGRIGCKTNGWSQQGGLEL
jgi:hypothetical protein